jgi:TrkA domain protein
MRVRETQVPGVGDRFVVEFDDEESQEGEEGEPPRLTVLVHNDGRREVFWRPDADADAEELFAVDERDARRLGEILDGSYFEPVDSEVVDALENAVVEWVEVPAGSPMVGRTIGEAGVRTATGATVLAAQRGRRTVSTPGAEFRVEAGDVLVVAGGAAAQRAFESLLAGDGSEAGAGDVGDDGTAEDG